VKLADQVAPVAEQCVPIEMPQVVAWAVLAVTRELDSRASPFGAMLAPAEPCREQADAQVGSRWGQVPDPTP